MRKLALMMALILTTNSINFNIVYAKERDDINFKNVTTDSAVNVESDTNFNDEIDSTTSSAILLERNINNNDDVFIFDIVNNENSSTVTGFVYDENNKPLKNATVQFFLLWF